MIGYSQRLAFSEREVRLWFQASTLVGLLPERWKGHPHGLVWNPMRPDDDHSDIPEVRCHEVARAIGRILHLEVIDGHYGAVEHSWLMTMWRYPGKGPMPSTSILDVYAVGQLPMVQLVGLEPTVPASRNYVIGSPRDDVKNELVQAMVRWLAPHAVAIGLERPVL